MIETLQDFGVYVKVHLEKVGPRAVAVVTSRSLEETEKCTFDTSQQRIGLKTQVRIQTQAQIRKLTVDAILACSFSFDVVENPKFRNLVLSGSGRSNLRLLCTKLYRKI